MYVGARSLSAGWAADLGGVSGRGCHHHRHRQLYSRRHRMRAIHTYMHTNIQTYIHAAIIVVMVTVDPFLDLCIS